MENYDSSTVLIFYKILDHFVKIETSLIREVPNFKIPDLYGFMNSLGLGIKSFRALPGISQFDINTSFYFSRLLLSRERPCEN